MPTARADGQCDKEENVMETSPSARPGIVEKLRNALASLVREEKFTCGDCDRWERCGQRPSEQCVARAAQIEAADGYVHRKNPLAGW
jgi:hypothetical protein